MITNPTTDVRSADPAAEYVLPGPPRPAGDVVVVSPRRDDGRVWRRGSLVAQVLGERFLMQGESQQIFNGELRQRLLDLDQSIAEVTKAQLKGAVRELLAVLDWSDAVTADLLLEARRAAGGLEPVDVVDVCQSVAAELQDGALPIHVADVEVASWWGSAGALAETVRLGIALVTERTQGVGARLIDIEADPEAVRLHITAAGEPSDGVEGATAQRFRRAVEGLGARVEPGPFGPGGAGFVLVLPLEPAAAVG